MFGADIIAGFPTETEAMFARSLDIVDECGLTHLHVFPFSPRPGTPAARMPQVARDLVKERARRAAGEAATEALLAPSRPRGRRQRSGCSSRRTSSAAPKRFTPVRFRDPVEPGEIRHVRIAGHDGRELVAA